MKKISIIFITLTFILLITGCDDEKKIVSNGEMVNTANMEHKHCTRSASGSDAITTELSYELYYTGDKLNILESTEKVIATKDEDLDTYQQAYEQIDSYYEGLEYYDTEVIRGDTSVTRKATINYDKINIKQLLDIEGEEDNIIKDGEAKVDLWLELAKKFGTKCEIVEE